MSEYLVIATRDACGEGLAWSAQLARAFADEGAPVCLFLAENAALAARPGTACSDLAEVADAGVEIIVDRFALEERGIAEQRIAPSLAIGDLGTVIDLLAAGRKAVWL